MKLRLAFHTDAQLVHACHAYTYCKAVRPAVACACRGDWPELQPKEWSPVTQQLAADRQAKLAAL